MRNGQPDSSGFAISLMMKRPPLLIERQERLNLRREIALAGLLRKLDGIAGDIGGLSKPPGFRVCRSQRI